MTFDFLKTLYNDIMLMLDKLVVKRADLARNAETTESAVSFELYYACLKGSRYFYNFSKFDITILQKYLPPDKVTECYYDKNAIPENVRSQIVEDQAIIVINSYEEMNEYYRMLAGLPPRNSTNWIYLSNIPGIPDNIPIHQLTDEQISQLEISGEFDKILSQYTDESYEYLNYLGTNRIDIITARLAKPFEIIRLGAPSNNRTKAMFENEYYAARRYIISTVYNRASVTTKTLYDPVMGVIMLTLAIRNTLVPTEASYLNFDEILNAILESYGLLKYFEKFPFTYKKRLVMALDSILKVKGTDGVLVDICRLFSFDNFTANRYFLMKTHKKDRDGNIIFGDTPEDSYDLNFIKAAIEDHELTYTEDNLVDYDTVTSNDYLWQLTEEERNKMLQDNFNIMMTKYIDIEAAYDLSSLTFEVCYFINMILQTRENWATVTCTNTYAKSGVSTAYTMLVFLLSALAKRSNFDGNIVYEPEHIAEILRFDLSDISEQITTIHNSYEMQIDVTDNTIPEYDVVSLTKPSGNENSNSAVEIYLENKKLYDAILNEMRTTTDIRKYTALMNLKNCMYISAMEKRDFQKSDGSAAVTYYDMLSDIDPYLANKLDKIDITDEIGVNDLDRMILYILEKLEETFNREELQYLFLNTPNAYGTLIAKYLRTAINVFKASSVQLESINVMFIVGENDPVRAIDQKIIHANRDINDIVHAIDEFSFDSEIVIDDYVRMMDKAYTNEN